MLLNLSNWNYSIFPPLLVCNYEIIQSIEIFIISKDRRSKDKICISRNLFDVSEFSHPDFRLHKITPPPSPCHSTSHKIRSCTQQIGLNQVKKNSIGEEKKNWSWILLIFLFEVGPWSSNQYFVASNRAGERTKERNKTFQSICRLAVWFVFCYTKHLPQMPNNNNNSHSSFFNNWETIEYICQK